MAFRGHYEHSIDAKDRLTIPRRFRAALSDGASSQLARRLCRHIRPRGLRDLQDRYSAQQNPLSQRGRRMVRRFHASADDETLDSAGRVRIAQHLTEHAQLEAGPVRRDRRRRPPGDLEHQGLGRGTTPRSTSPRPSRRGARRRAGTGRGAWPLDGHTDPHAHGARPSPGLRAARRPRPTSGRDGNRLHLRRRRPRPGGRRAARAGGTLIAIDRDPVAERRFAELEDELEPRGALRGPTSPMPSRHLGEEGVASNSIYLDLGVSSLQLDAAERGFSYSYDAPLDMRMDPDAGALRRRPRERMARGADRHRPSRIRGGAARALDRARDRAPPPAAHHCGAGGRDSSVRPALVPVRPRPSGQAELPGPSHRRERRARFARPRTPGGMEPAA